MMSHQKNKRGKLKTFDCTAMYKLVIKTSAENMVDVDGLPLPIRQKFACDRLFFIFQKLVQTSS